MPGDLGLAPREAQVLELVACGLANKEIARRLEPPVSEETVKGYLRHIYMKLGVQSRTAAVAIWLRRERHLDSDSR